MTSDCEKCRHMVAGYSFLDDLGCPVTIDLCKKFGVPCHYTKSCYCRDDNRDEELLKKLRVIKDG